MDSLLHDVRNELAVAIASVQAFIDGKLEPNTEALEDVLAALKEANRLLSGLRSQ